MGALDLQLKLSKFSSAKLIENFYLSKIDKTN